MDNRGSKSIINSYNPTSQKKFVIVKEQRVDGSRYFNNVFKVYSNGFRKKLSSQNPFSKHNSQCKNYSTFNKCNSINLDPLFVTGFIDAEGSFLVTISKSISNRTGWNIQLRFKISLHKKDLPVLIKLQSFFSGVGKIDKAGKDRDSFSYTITSLNDIITQIIPHFDKYPLESQKKADYELFKRVVNKMKNKEHLTNIGLQEIVNIRASLNLGLSTTLKEAFPNTVPVNKPFIENQITPNPQ